MCITNMCRVQEALRWSGMCITNMCRVQEAPRWSGMCITNMCKVQEIQVGVGCVSQICVGRKKL